MIVHPGTDLLAIMERKDIVRMIIVLKGLMCSKLMLNSPSNGLESGHVSFGFA